MKNIGQQLLCAQWALNEIQKILIDPYYQDYAQQGDLEEDILKIVNDARLAMEEWDDQAGSSG